MATAFITGAGVRIGAAVARALADTGFDLVLHAHGSADKLAPLAQALSKEGRTVHTVTGDLSSEEGVAGLAKEVRALVPALDVLVNNAGLFEKTPFAEITRAAYRRMQAVNLEAPFFLTQALLPALCAAKAPCVVNVGDIAGERPLSGYAHYSVSKAGLLMLTRALALELSPHIRVNAVSPGTVAFPESYTAEERAKVLARVPMEREGTVADIAKAVLFLCRDAPYVTGQVLAVDGGRSARL